MAIKLHDHDSVSNHHRSDYGSAQDKFDASRGAYFTGRQQRLDTIAQKHGVDPNNIHQHPQAYREFKKQEKPHLEAQRSLEHAIETGSRGGVYHISATGTKVYEKK